VTGVQVGTATAVGLQLAKHTPKLLSYSILEDNENTVKLEGDITFVSAGRISMLQRELLGLAVSEDSPVVVDFSEVRSVDATGCEMIVDIMYGMEELGHSPKSLKVKGLSREQRRVLEVCDSRGLVAKFFSF